LESPFPQNSEIKHDEKSSSFKRLSFHKFPTDIILGKTINFENMDSEYFSRRHEAYNNQYGNPNIIYSTNNNIYNNNTNSMHSFEYNNNNINNINNYNNIKSENSYSTSKKDSELSIKNDEEGENNSKSKKFIIYYFLFY
jgi:hypothetical protein